MDLTSTFNEAANGNHDPEPVGQGESPHLPSGPSSSAIAAEADQIPETAKADLSTHFNRHQILWEDPDLDDEETLADDRGQKISDAQAEIERLEHGRAEPRLENKLRPARRLEQIVHTHEEEQREFRIAALKTYLQFASDQALDNPEHARRNDVEFSL